MTDRIKLAKAMFPKHEFDHNHAGDLLMCPAGRWDKDEWIRDVPDPFTDANDDYKVLEWIRNADRLDFTDDQYGRFLRAMSDKVWVPHRVPYNDQWWNYKIGDYARAALKVIDSA